MDETVLSFESKIEFIANIDETKDCLMNQGPHQGGDVSEPELWFNIDIPKGHGLKAGDVIRIIVKRA